MLRLILAAVLFLLILVGGIAAALFHFYGWKGMIAFPFIVLALVWVGKVLIGKIIKGFALGLFSMKSSVLRGATMTLHSITPVPEPPEADIEDLEDEEDESEERAAATADEEEEENEDHDEEEIEQDEADAEEKPKHYYAVDVTITPGTSGQNRAWEPGEFILSSEPVKNLEQLEEKEVGSVREIRIWDGSEFGPDDECKYPGEQRLKVTFAVVPGTSKAWLQYYNESIGSFDLPRWVPAV